MRSFRALLHLPFAMLWLGQTVSRLGDSIYKVALAWWVLEKTGSATSMGLVLVFSMLPMLFLLIFGGAAVDRYDRRHIMLASDLLRGLTVAIVAGLAWAGLLEVWHIFLASFVFGAVNAFFQPAYTAIVPQIIPQELRTSANSLTSLSAQLTSLAGPVLGAVLFKVAGSSLSFALDSASFFISALFLLPLLNLSIPEINKQLARGILGDIRSGIRAVSVLPWLWITVLLAAAVNVTNGGPHQVALPFLVDKSLGGGVGTLGLLGSAAAAGAVISALWLGNYTHIHRKGLYSYLAWMLNGLALALLGFVDSLPVAIGLMVLLGFGNETFGLLWSNMLQEYVPAEQFGRVASIDYLGSFALLPVGYVVAGWLTDLLGPNLVFMIGGICTVVILALGLLHPSVHQLD